MKGLFLIEDLSEGAILFATPRDDFFYLCSHVKEGTHLARVIRGRNLGDIFHLGGIRFDIRRSCDAFGYMLES